MDLGITKMRAAVAAGTAGLGFGTAKALAAEGVAVAVCGRDAQRVAAAVRELDDVAGAAPAVGIVADMASSDDAERFVAEAAQQLGGPLDILVCNDGGPPGGTFATTDLDAYRSAIELNCMSTIAMCRAAVPAMVERRWGRVVAVTSIGARQPIGYLAASVTARTAVTGFLKVLSTEVAPHGVTVNNLQPGLHATRRMTDLYGDAPDTSAIPAGATGDPDDFGAIAAFLCSKQAAFVTGVGLHIDGGAYRGLQ